MLRLGLTAAFQVTWVQILSVQCRQSRALLHDKSPELIGLCFYQILYHITQVFTKHCPNIFRNRPTPQFVEQAIKQSLTTLRMPKLDLVQLHWWDYEVPGMVDVAKSLADLREQGLITSIGTTNMSTEALAQIVDAGVPIVCNQV